jgi:hypothetical protein
MRDDKEEEEEEFRAYKKEELKSLCLTEHHTMKTYWENGGIAPRIPDLGTRWR